MKTAKITADQTNKSAEVVNAEEQLDRLGQDIVFDINQINDLIEAADALSTFLYRAFEHVEDGNHWQAFVSGTSYILDDMVKHVRYRQVQVEKAFHAGRKLSCMIASGELVLAKQLGPKSVRNQ